MIADKYVRTMRWLIPILFGGISLAYLAIVLQVGDGRPVAPLDDSYILYQYARQTARGRPWQYNDGDPPSKGTTSLLYPWLLAGFYKLGCRDERLVWVAMFSGVLWLGGIVLWTGKVWDALALSGPHPERWSTIAALTVLLTGIVQWGAFTGMETGLFTLLILMALESVLRQRAMLAALWLGLAGLTRPEEVILALLAWFISLCAFAGRMRSRIGSSARPRLLVLGDAFVRVSPLGVAVLVGLVPSLLNWLVTGNPNFAGLEAKAWFYNVPQIWGDILRSIALSYWHVFLRILNSWGKHEISGSLVAWGTTVMALIGWGTLASRRRWIPLLLTAAWFWLGTLSTATLMTATWHLGRYQAPFVPIAVIVAVAGISNLWESAFRHTIVPGRAARTAARIAAAAMVVWLLGTSLLSTYHALAAFRQTLKTMTRQQLVLADWLHDHLPPGARVRVHDTGSLRYVGQRPTYDLIGLTTAETTQAWRHASGSVFEQMEHSPYRPDYFALYPDVLSIPYLAATDLFARELFRVHVSDYSVVSAGPVQGVWQADWRLAGSGKPMAQPDILARTRGLAVVDTLDVADLADEAAHHFQWWHGAQHSGFPTEVYQMHYHAPPHTEVLDGGRRVSGGMAFQISTQPGQALWIAARLHAQQAGAVQVTVNGHPIGRWAYPNLPGAWLESLFPVPAELIVGRQTEIRLQADTSDTHFQHYAAYYFWFLQVQPQGDLMGISHPLDVAFDRELHLLGFDLDQDVLRPGQALTTTLYRKTNVLAESEAKVFLHLYDAQGNLGPQADSSPVHGTRPPYTWQPNEVVRDQRTLVLPPDLLPGRYDLEVGLYDQEGRLTPHSETMKAFLEKRVPPAEVEVLEPK